MPLQGTGAGGVLHVIGRLNVGGPAHLVAALARTGRTVVAAGSVQDGEVEHVDLSGVELHRIPGLGRRVHPLDDARALAALVGLLGRQQPRVVHTHTAKGGVVGRAAAASVRRAATVHTFHGHLLYGYFPPRTTAAVAAVERVLARRTDRLVTVGRRVRDELLAAGIGREEQYVVLPPGVTPPAVVERQQARAALGVTPDRPVVAFVGRLAPIKRPERVLAVARALPDVEFLVAGDGGLRAGLEQAAPPNVRFLGWRGDIGMLYSASDLALLTSDNEGMPLSLVEAGMCGVAAVTTDVGSASEVVQHMRTGLVVQPSVEQLVQAVQRLLTDDALRASLGAQAATWTHEQFSVEQMVTAHRNLYATLG